MPADTRFLERGRSPSTSTTAPWSLGPEGAWRRSERRLQLQVPEELIGGRNSQARHGRSPETQAPPPVSWSPRRRATGGCNAAVSRHAISRPLRRFGSSRRTCRRAVAPPGSRRRSAFRPVLQQVHRRLRAGRPASVFGRAMTCSSRRSGSLTVPLCDGEAFRRATLLRMKDFEAGRAGGHSKRPRLRWRPWRRLGRSRGFGSPRRGRTRGSHGTAKS